MTALRMDTPDLFAASVDDLDRIEGARRRRAVGQGGICPCGAHVKSWPWADRVQGIPEPPHRVVYHLDDCPALLAPLEATS
jgi:hypothetical protein